MHKSTEGVKNLKQCATYLEAIIVTFKNLQELGVVERLQGQIIANFSAFLET